MVQYLVDLMIWIGIYGLFSLGLNLQWGFTGLINFGHVAFMTLGAYATVLLSLKGIPILLAVILGAIAAALFGLLIGASTLKLREDYLAIVTIGAGELLRLVALNEEWLTKGAFGVQRYPLPLGNFQPNVVGKSAMILLLTFITVFTVWQLWRNIQKGLKNRLDIQDKSYQPRPQISVIIWGIIAFVLLLTVYLTSFFSIVDYTYKSGLLLLILLILAIAYFSLEILVHSPWGRILKAIREDEEIPLALGKNVFWYKLQSFMIGGVIAGIAGALYAWQLTSIYSTNFEPLLTFNAWIIVVLGGSGNNAGTLLGAIIFWTYDSLTRFAFAKIEFINAAQSGALRVMIIGLILIILMVWRPQGILGKKEELTLGR